MNEKIIRQIGDCKVNIVFGCSNPDLKENIMWTMMENYKSRLSEQRDKTVKSEDKKKSTRKVYKVHKYKKSATSKAARSAQGKGRSRKKR